MKHILLRRLTALLLILTLAAAAPVAARAAAWGDINADGAINASDALMALQHSVRLITLTGGGEQVADVNADGEINASDALLILQYSVRLIDRFPAEDRIRTDPWTGQPVGISKREAVSMDGIITTFQNGGNYDPGYDVQSDSVMVYADSVNGSDALLRSWVENGGERTIDIMLSANRAVSQNEYTSRYGGNYDYELQRVSTGERIEPNGVPYNVPIANFIDYKWEIIRHHCANYPIRMVVLEEPEIWRSCGYSPAFKDEWAAYYGTPWQDQNESPAAMWRTCRLKVYLWQRYLTTLAERTKQQFPDVKVVVATHSVLSYNSIGIIAGVSHYASLPGVDGIIGQTWSNTVAVQVRYEGQNVTRRFESGYVGYASFAGAVKENEMLFTLSDPYADHANQTWEYYTDTYQKTLVAQLLQPTVNRFQETIWLNRSFTSTVPSEYRTVQMNVFNALPQLAGQETTVYAGTPGIAVALSDTLSWQYGGGEAMACSNSNQGFYGLTLPLVERGLPVSLPSLDRLQSADDLAGVKVLVLCYDIQKPLDAGTNAAIADWVKAGGVLLFLGGADGYSTDVEDDWWGKAGTTPTAHLFDQLGLKVNARSFDFFGTLEWRGPAGRGEALHDSVVMSDGFVTCYTGEGLTPLLTSLDETIGFEKAVGQGRVIAVGLPSATYSAFDGSQKLADLVRLAVERAGQTYIESNTMTVQRGDFIATETLSEGAVLTGSFIDLFDPDLGIIAEKRLEADSSAFLLDLTSRRTPGVPRLAFAGGSLRGEITETADATSYSLFGPKGSTTAARLLGNGRYPQAVAVTRADGTPYPQVVARWDNATASLSVKIDHDSTDRLTVAVTWGDTPVPDTPPYTVQKLTVTTNDQNRDADFLHINNATAGRSMRQCQYEETLVYAIDRKAYDHAAASLEVYYNYLIEVSNDQKTWTTVCDYRDVSDEYTERTTNRTLVGVSSPDPEADMLYIRLSNTDPSRAYGTGIRSLTVIYRTPAEE